MITLTLLLLILTFTLIEIAEKFAYAWVERLIIPVAFAKVFSVILLPFLLISSILYLSADNDYDKFVIEGKSIQQTLDNARKTNESTAVWPAVTDWNSDLAIYKYCNTTFFEEYVDDRMNNLEPIK